MQPGLEIDVVTLFPGMLTGFLEASILKRAQERGLVRVGLLDPRTFTEDVHRTADDRPYGGGPGMVMKPEPLFKAVESLRRNDSQVILLTPQGKPFRQEKARTLAACRHLILVCGHYEGVDERVRTALVDEELSIGDYVLTNGALAAAVVVDAVVRLVPGVLGGGEAATDNESFTGPVLEYPHYTRPAEFRGMRVPDVLLSGNHAEIAAWREREAARRTRERRPDLR